MKNKKYGVYTLGVGLLALFGVMPQVSTIAALSPAEKSIDRSSFDKQEDHIEKSPGMKRGEFKSSMKDHNETVKSLSPKNKTVFHNLSSDDQEKVVHAHKNGYNAHKKIGEVLKDDTKTHDKMKMHTNSDSANSNSPASKAMNKHKKQNIYD